MAERTPFAGLLRVPPGEPISIEGFELQYLDPLVVDHLLKIGAVLHKHDGAAALGNPAAAPEITTEATGGSIPAETTVQVAYTQIDAQGGETLPSPAKAVTTTPAFPNPQEVPSLAVSYAAGTLLAANYIYGVTVTDGEGGESILSPLAEAVVEPGFASAEVTVTHLKKILEEVAGVTVGAEWRLWRRQNGGEWNLIDVGTGETIVDNGTLVPDCTVQPPTVSTAKATSKLTVTVPKLTAGSEFFRLYLTTDGTFGPVSFVAEYPLAEEEKAIHLTTLAVLPGTPPVVSRAIPHANKIDPDTDLIEWHWRRPVKKVSELPTEGNEEADVRFVTETRKLYFWNVGEKVWKQVTVEAEVTFIEGIGWSIAGEIAAAIIPGKFIWNAAAEAQHLIGLEASIAKGKVKLSVLVNGAAVPELKEVIVEKGTRLSIELVTPLKLETHDSVMLVIEHTEEAPEGLQATAFDEHTMS